MVDYGNATKDRWVCPNDRQLALRAKLKTGWSVKTQSLQQYGSQNSSLDESEQEVILQVIKRAEMLEVTEQERVGRLVERLENMKRHALGNGTNQCVLCGDSFGMLGSPSLLCHDCKKAVCHKCGIETVSSQKEPMSLCKICSETREMWKKSGAWFFKGLPKYVLPEKKSPQPGRYGPRRIQRLGIDKNSWSRSGALSTSRAEEEESSSEDEANRRSRHHASAAAAASAPAAATAAAAAAANGKNIPTRIAWRLPATRQTSVSFDLSGATSAGTTAVMRAASPAPGSFYSQRSESLSLSLASDGDSAAEALGDERGSFFRESVDSESSGGATTSGSGGGGGGSGGSGAGAPVRAASLSSSHDAAAWDADAEAAALAYYSPQQHSAQVRRDSQASSQSQREWAWEERWQGGSSGGGGGAGGGQRVASSAEDLADPALLDHAQLGTIELSLLYDPVVTALHCSLHRAKGLKPMDINGLSDPFCRLNLLPTGGKSNRLRTKTVHKTRNPEFNETLTFYGVTESDLAKKVMHILVLDDDKYGHDFIGEARIPLLRIQPQQVRHLIVPLEKHFLVEQEDEVWGNDAWTRGQILITLCYSTRRRALVVGIIRCANLIPMDNNGFSDPFVKLRLKPDPYHRKYKTSIKWKNLNPVFNEEFVFDTKMTELPKQTLEITVWDKDYGKSNDYLGGLELGFHSKGERLKHWVDMIKFPDHKHEGWHNLGEEILGD